jgi:2-keto-4-pentenoate hydratase
MWVAEAEFAFRIGRELEGTPPFAMDQVAASVASIHLAVELPDSRFATFDDLGPAVLLADDACAGRYLIGQDVGLISEDELRQTETRLLIDGNVIASGSGANVLKGPWSALTWLANALPAYGWRLQPGEIVLTGTTTAPLPVKPGISIRASFGSLGSLSFVLSET